MQHNVYLLRLKSRWAGVTPMWEVLQVLALILKAYDDTHCPVFLLDCCPAHLQPEIGKGFKRRGPTPLFVPAKMTGLLQPLDAYVFARYKRELRKRFYCLRSSQNGHLPDRLQFWKTLMQHVDVFMSSTNWTSPFELTGWTNRQQGTSNYIRRRLKFTDVIDVGSGRPTDSQLETIFPRSRKSEGTVWLPRERHPVSLPGGRASQQTLASGIGPQRLPPDSLASEREPWRS
jgi:hypothetical protein